MGNGIFMNEQSFEILKQSGKKVRFSIDKLRASLARTGADEKTIKHIINVVRDELYQGISSKEIYNRAFALLQKENRFCASKYKLKNALYELGPTGFPFEKFVAKLLEFSGYTVELNQVIQGKCVSHEIDILAHKKEKTNLIECKFHNEQELNCNVKVPLYIHSRYQDVQDNWHNLKDRKTQLEDCWIVTNTRFTADAIDYAICSNIQLLSWDFPEGNSLKDRIDRLRLYPITVSTLLSAEEKNFLIDKEVILFRELIEKSFYLDYLGISESRITKILEEVNNLC